MNIQLKVNGKTIRVLNIPIENPDYNCDNLGNDFEDWVKDWFGVED